MTKIIIGVCIGTFLGLALADVLGLFVNRICFANGECHVFYTAQQMKDWVYEARCK